MKIHPKALPFLNILRSSIKHRSVKRLSPRPCQVCHKIIQPEDFNEGWYKFCSDECEEEFASMMREAAEEMERIKEYEGRLTL